MKDEVRSIKNQFAILKDEKSTPKEQFDEKISEIKKYRIAERKSADDLSIEDNNASLERQFSANKNQFDAKVTEIEKNEESCSLEMHPIKSSQADFTTTKETEIATEKQSKTLEDETNCDVEQKSAESVLRTSTIFQRKRSMTEENSSFSREQKKKVSKKQWSVAKLVDHELRSGVMFFRVRWKGYKSTDDTWEPETNLNCPELLSSYKSSNDIQ